jgi:hypothetical protein
MDDLYQTPNFERREFLVKEVRALRKELATTKTSGRMQQLEQYAVEALTAHEHHLKSKTDQAKRDKAVADEAVANEVPAEKASADEVPLMRPQPMKSPLIKGS